MPRNDAPDTYEPPAIDDRFAVGDPLIIGYVSPAWRRPDAQPGSADAGR